MIKGRITASDDLVQMRYWCIDIIWMKDIEHLLSSNTHNTFIISNDHWNFTFPLIENEDIDSEIQRDCLEIHSVSL